MRVWTSMGWKEILRRPHDEDARAILLRFGRDVQLDGSRISVGASLRQRGLRYPQTNRAEGCDLESRVAQPSRLHSSGCEGQRRQDHAVANRDASSELVA